MPSIELLNQGPKSWKIMDYRDTTGVLQIMIFPKGLYRMKTVGEKTILIETYNGRRIFEFDEETMNLLGWDPTDHSKNCDTISNIIYEQ
jgi:hypothetical protein